MPQHRPLTPAAPWVEVVATDEDWDAADPQLLRTFYAQLVWIRAFEQYVLDLAGAGLIHGPAHSSIGQEGGAVGSVLALTSEDSVNGSHRGHHQFLAKALHHVEPKGMDPLAPPSDDVRDVLLRTLAEIAGLDRGWSHGRGGSMHLQWKEAGAMGTNAIVGGGVPQAAGFAFAHQRSGTDAVSVTYFGDGAVNIGSTLETMNLAGAWSLPVCFFIENNRYAVSTSVEEATAEPRLSARGMGFNLASWKVDGQDPLAVHLAMTEAVEHMRAGRGSTVVEVDTYRFFHQNGGFAGSAFGYRDKEEEKAWRLRDPLTITSAHLERLGLLEDGEADRALAPGQGRDGGDRRRAARAGPRRQARPAPDPRRRVARPRVGRRRRPRRPLRDGRRPGGGRRGARRARARHEAGRVDRRRPRPPDGDRPRGDRHGRGRPPAQRRHQRRHPGPQRALPRPGARHAHQRERLHRPGLRRRARRPLHAGRGVHVRRLHVGRRRPALQPGRPGAAHVRRGRRRTPRPAQQGRDGHRLRLPALDGPRRHLRHLGRAGASSRRARPTTTSA